MMTPKTLSNIFARRVIERPEAFDLFCRLCGSRIARGRSPRGANPAIWSRSIPTSRRRSLRCHVEQFQFSAHASRESNLDYVKKLAPKKVVLVHGDLPAVEWVRAAVAAALPECEVIVPDAGRGDRIVKREW